MAVGDWFSGLFGNTTSGGGYIPPSTQPWQYTNTSTVPYPDYDSLASIKGYVIKEMANYWSTFSYEQIANFVTYTNIELQSPYLPTEVLIKIQLPKQTKPVILGFNVPVEEQAVLNNPDKYFPADFSIEIERAMVKALLMCNVKLP